MEFQARWLKTRVVT